jgi:hypothetical protein
MNDALKQLYQSSVKFLYSGDINISYLTEREREREIEDAIMSTYNLT